MVAIRGAITVKQNTSEEILEATTVLLQEILETNAIDQDKIISIIFTATKDLDAVYPAIAARDLGITDGGLLCMQEMNVVDSLQMCIRVLVHVEANVKQGDVNHVYLRGAKVLRPDLSS